MSLLDKLGKFDKKISQEEKNQIKIHNKKEIEKIAPELEKKIDSLIESAEIINAPIRVMLSIVTQLKMFDKTSIGLTPKGGNKKELKAEIISLVSKLAEK